MSRPNSNHSAANGAGSQWRGGQSTVEEASAEHQWQVGNLQQSTTVWWKAPGLRVGIWGLLFLCLLGGFIYRLLLARPRVPLIAVVATEYDWPLLPNAWAQEDLDQLAALENIRLLDSSPAWRTQDTGMAELRRLLEQVDDNASEPLIIYVSMHSAVSTDAAGKPIAYLLPPGCDPIAEDTWLPLGDFVSQLVRQAPNREKLLVLDCQDQQLNPQIGSLANDAVGLLPDLTQLHSQAKLTIVTAADSGQVSWSSEGLRGSIFGHAFRDGLRGQADWSGGNSDGHVSFGELRDYVQRHVSHWSRTYRDVDQNPQFFQTGDPRASRKVAWSMRTAPVFKPQQAATLSVPLDSLWRQFDELRSTDTNALAPYGKSPFGWRQLQAKLMMLEALSSSGYGYGRRAFDLAEQLQQQLDDVAASLNSTNTVEDAWQGLSHSATPIGGELKAHSLPMSRLVGGVPASQRSLLKSSLADFVSQPTAANLRETLGKIEQAANNVIAPGDFVEVHQLRLLEKYLPMDWQPSAPVRRALALRKEAELAATPIDYRCWPWLKQAIEAGDQARRPVEDALLTPKALADEPLTGLLDRAEQQYQAAQDQAARISRTLQIRDAIWAQAPTLATWFLRYGAQRVEAADDRDLAARFDELIAATRQLDETLAAQGDLDSFYNESGDLALAEPWKQLQQYFRQDVQRLTDLESPTAAETREIQQLLMQPLLPMEARSRLRTILSQAADESWSPSAAAPRQNQKDVSELTYDRWISNAWKRHPIVEMLGIRPADEELGSQAIATRGAKIRATLRQIANLNEASAESSDDEFQQLTLQAQQARVAAGIGVGPRRFDPLAKHWRMQLRRFFLWQADRAQADLLGPARPGSLASQESTAMEARVNLSGQDSFFVVASSSYRANAGLLAPLSKQLMQQVERSLAQANAKVRKALRVKAKSRLLLDEASSFDVDCEVAPIAGGLGQGAAGTAFAAVVIRDNSQARVSPYELTPLDALSESKLTVAAEVVQRQGSQLEAVAVFRGHEYGTLFEVEGLHGARIDFRPTKFEETRVTVRPNRQKGKSVVFVLDCSASMQETLPGEGGQPSRLEIAKSRLQSVLDQAAEQGATRVGVRFFGHRLGWTREAPLEVRVQEQYLDAVLNDVAPAERDVLEQSIRSLSPSQDVEAMLRPGFFGQEELRRVRMRLKSLQPWGQSPLYLAVAQAIVDLEEEPVEYAKSIVVVTDGLNYQWTPQDRRSAAPPNTTLQNVTESNESGIPVFIVGFGVPAEEQQQAEAVYTQLTASSGGGFVSVNRADDLLATLQGVFRQRVYGLRDATGQLAAAAANRSPGLVPLGVPLRIATNPARKFSVEAPPDVTATIQLQGGEDLQLQLSDDGRQLLPVPFTDQVVGSAPTVDSAKRPTGRVARIHQPSVTAGALQASISLQHVQDLVTQRPHDVWLELTPCDETGQPLSKSYVLYDPNFAANQPVPVLQTKLEGWPREASQGKLSGWFRAKVAKADHRQSLAPVVDDLDAFAQFRPLPGVTGVQYRVAVEATELPNAPFRVQVIQRYDAQATPVRSWLRCDELELVRVIRKFDHEHAIDSHTFYMNAQSILQLAHCELQFTTRETITTGSSRTADPIVFPIFSAGDTLPLSDDGGLQLNPAQGN